MELKADWSKGYSRLGAAYHGLNQYEEAIQAYKKGLELDPQNASLKKGLEEAEAEQAASGNPFGKEEIFNHFFLFY